MVHPYVAAIDQPQSRPFTLGDRMILVIALALGLALARPIIRSLAFKIGSVPPNYFWTPGAGPQTRTDPHHDRALLPLLPPAGLRGLATQAPAHTVAVADPPARIRRLCRALRRLPRLCAVRPTCGFWGRRASHLAGREGRSRRRRAAGLGILDRDSPVESRADMDRPFRPHPGCFVDGLRPGDILLIGLRSGSLRLPLVTRDSSLTTPNRPPQEPPRNVLSNSLGSPP